MITGEDIKDLEEEDLLRTLMATTDPENFGKVVPGQTVPALTILLYKVCDNNQEKFNEACRLVDLFIKKDRELHARHKR